MAAGEDHACPANLRATCTEPAAPSSRQAATVSPVALRASETPEKVPAASARTLWLPMVVALAVLLRTTALVVLREAHTTVATPAGPTSTWGEDAGWLPSDTLRGAPKACPAGATEIFTALEPPVGVPAQTTAVTPPGPIDTSGSVATSPVALTVVAGVQATPGVRRDTCTRPPATHAATADPEPSVDSTTSEPAGAKVLAGASPALAPAGEGTASTAPTTPSATPMMPTT